MHVDVLLLSIFARMNNGLIEVIEGFLASSTRQLGN
jgi:hypothetical protein